MNFKQGSNSFAFGKIKLGSTSVNKIYFGSNFVWLVPVLSSCATEGTCSYIVPISSCATEGSCIRL